MKQGESMIILGVIDGSKPPTTYKSIVMFRDLPYYNAWLGLAIFIMTPVVFVVKNTQNTKNIQKLRPDYGNTSEIEGCKNGAGQW